MPEQPTPLIRRLESRYASGAVAAMSGELAARGGVTQLRAVLKRTEAASVSLLERLAFERASPASEAQQAIPHDEALMERTLPIDGVKENPDG